MQISPGTTRFFPSIYLPHLSRMIPCSYWASACRAVLPSCETFYVVSVRQARGLPVVSLFPHPASFRFRLAADTLAFGYTLPTTGWVRDFHPLETCAAGRTKRKPAARGRGKADFYFGFLQLLQYPDAHLQQLRAVCNCKFHHGTYIAYPYSRSSDSSCSP